MSEYTPINLGCHLKPVQLSEQMTNVKQEKAKEKGRIGKKKQTTQQPEG